MSAKLIVVLASFCVVQTSLAALLRAIAPVTDASLKAQGYACQKEGFPSMKDNEQNPNFSKQLCQSVHCRAGVLTFATCPTIKVEGGKLVPENPEKPYPECCGHP